MNTRTKPFLLLLATVLVTLLAGCSKDSKAAKHLARGESYFQAGDYEKAKIEFMNVLALSRTNPVATVRIATIFYDQGSMLQALPALTQARKVAPGDWVSRARLASALLSNNEVQKAREEVLAVLSAQPTNELATLLIAYSVRNETHLKESTQRLEQLRGQGGDRPSLRVAQANLLMRRQDRAGALAELQKALQLDPASAIAHNAMANILIAQTNPVQAEVHFKAAARSASPRSFERLGFAEFLAGRGRLAESRAELKDILEKASDYLPAKRLLASIELAENHPDDALRLVEEILRVDPIHFEAQMLRAQVFINQGKAPNAVEVLEKVDKSFSPLPNVKFQLATAYLLDKKMPKARTALEQAYLLDPDSIPIAQMKAQLDLRAGEPAKAVDALQPIARQRPGALGVQMLLGDAMMAMGRMPEAIAVYRGVLQQMPTNAPLWLGFGLALRQADKTAEARQAFDRARALDPKLAAATYQLVELELAERRYDKAMALLGTLPAEDRKTSATLAMEGRIHAAQRLWDKAEEALKKAIEADPSSTISYFLLAGVYSQSKQLDKAIQQLEGVVKLQPGQSRNALMTLGMLYTEKQDYARARQAYEGLIAETPGFVPALNNLAYLYAEYFNLPDKAYEFAQKARTLEGQDPMVADTLGWILFQRRMYSEALPLLRESVSRMRGNAEAAYHLGMTHYMLGQETQARAMLQSALSSKDPFKGREEAEKRLAWLGQNATKLSLAELESLVKSQPDDVVLGLRLGLKLEEQKRTADAVKVYEAVLARSPNATPVLARLARLYAGPMKDRAKANDLAQRAQKLGSEDPELAALAGRIAFDSGEFLKAYNLLREASAAVTNQASVTADFGWAAYSVGREGEALAQLQRALAIDPAFPGSVSARWLITLVGAIRDPKALAPLEKQVGELLASDPAHVPALMAQAGLASMKGQSQQAIAAYEKAIAVYPEFTPAKRLLALLYADVPGQEARATALANQARQLSPDDPDLNLALGKLSYRKQDFAGAIVFLQGAIARRPGDAEILYHLGMSLLQKGDSAKGRQSLERAIGAGLREPLAQEARRQLASVSPPPK